MPVSAPLGGEAVEHLEVRRGEYHDSVTLMLSGRAVGEVAGVERPLVAMGTELNVSLLAELGYELGGVAADAGPGDLIIAFVCSSPASEAAALDALNTFFSTSAASAFVGFAPAGSITAPGHTLHTPPDQHRPRTTATALGRTGAPITLISTPGLAAIPEAMESLEHGASPVIFSDNIPIHHEVRLKEEARRRGLLVMGPDCGTVVLHGTGLAFANVTRPGPLSLVAASGTGAQQLMSLLDAAGVGIRHCLGVGGRDLTAQVAGRSTLQALTALAEDEETEHIALVTKPPHPTIAARIKAHAATLPKPVHLAFVGPDHPTLTTAAESILTTLHHEPPTPWPHWTPTTKEDTKQNAPHRAPTIRGLFSGGTLRAEADAVLTRAQLHAHNNQKSGGRGEGESRKPTQPAAASDFTATFTPTLTPAFAPAFAFTFTLTDFGDDTYTCGRPHPMIDNTLRTRAIADAAADPAVGVLLLDVVLGRGAHPDPAADIAPAIASARAARPELGVVVSLCGTEGDPQGLERQARALADAGAWVYLSNAEAALAAARSARGGSPDHGR